MQRTEKAPWRVTLKNATTNAVDVQYVEAVTRSDAVEIAKEKTPLYWQDCTITATTQFDHSEIPFNDSDAVQAAVEIVKGIEEEEMQNITTHVTTEVSLITADQQIKDAIVKYFIDNNLQIMTTVEILQMFEDTDLKFSDVSKFLREHNIQ